MKKIKIMLLAVSLLPALGYAQVPGVCANIENTSVRWATPIDRFKPLATAAAPTVQVMLLDKVTGLVWDRCPLRFALDGSGRCMPTSGTVGFTWGEALAEVGTRNAAAHLGSSAWRLPNIKELASIVERRCVNPTLNTLLFPGTPSGSFWTSSPLAQTTPPSPSNNVAETKIWLVGFRGGQPVSYFPTSQAFARLVRDATAAELVP